MRGRKVSKGATETSVDKPPLMYIGLTVILISFVTGGVLWLSGVSMFTVGVHRVHSCMAYLLFTGALIWLVRTGMQTAELKFCPNAPWLWAIGFFVCILLGILSGLGLPYWIDNSSMVATASDVVSPAWLKLILAEKTAGGQFTSTGLVGRFVHWVSAFVSKGEKLLMSLHGIILPVLVLLGAGRIWIFPRSPERGESRVA